MFYSLATLFPMKYKRLPTIITPITADSMYPAEATSFEFSKEGPFGMLYPVLVHAISQRALQTPEAHI
jgi:hypothetical protein